MRGLDGNDWLIGGEGLDRLEGGSGSDQYDVNEIGEVVEAVGQGIDTVRTTLTSYTLDRNAENLLFNAPATALGTAFNGIGNELDNGIVGGAGSDTLQGLAGTDALVGLDGNDTLLGGAGDDLLDGGVGTDILRGGAGDDSYEVDVQGEVIEAAGEGVDTIRTTLASYTLEANVEDLLFSAPPTSPTTAFTGTGNELSNIIIGGAGNDELRGLGGIDVLVGLTGNDTLVGDEGNDVLDGGIGDDVMRGGLGNDFYFVGSPGDVVQEDADAGFDTIATTLASDSLGARPDVEALVGYASTGQSLTANAGDNYLRGFTGNDTLIGGRGSDTLIGREGNDTLNGEEGIDIALFSGAVSDYRVTFTNGAYSIQDVRSGGAPAGAEQEFVVGSRDGTDLLQGVEFVQFSNGTPNDLSDDRVIGVDFLGSVTALGGSGTLFNPTFYLSQNPDVAAAGRDPLVHYNEDGWREGRLPNALFDTYGYLAANPDVLRSGMNPLDHYAQYGAREGRDPSLFFDNEFYLAANPDVAAANMNPLAHYLAYGVAEGRQTSEAIGRSADFTRGSFDAEYYLLANRDVQIASVQSETQDAFAFAYQHYQNYGWREGRDPNSVFDTDGYLNAYADVRAADIDPLLHFDTYGWREGRDPSATFDTAAYRSENTDVAAAEINPLKHYLQYGLYEGRGTLGDGTFG
ncbi:hypothetical protein ASF36_24695 [Methylobacterium sp. Leaf90]|nr:hypothetical protein ASF36_24695 [Methylobacterium sp. Leaf90]